MKDLPLVLVTNDDGYGSPGIEAIVQALSAWAQVVVIAPATEQSACSHKFTVNSPMVWTRGGEGRFVLDGTPADCVYMGVFGGKRVMPRIPDLVVSGLNAGCNLGLDTYYSGTVAGAREAVLRGISALAVSAEPGTNLRKAAALCSHLAFRLIEIRHELESPILLNVNIPHKGSWELRKTRLGRRLYGEAVDFRTSPRGVEYLWFGGPGKHRDDSTPGVDTEAIQRGYVGVTYLPLVPGHEVLDDFLDALLQGVSQDNGDSR